MIKFQLKDLVILKILVDNSFTSLVLICLILMGCTNEEKFVQKTLHSVSKLNSLSFKGKAFSYRSSSEDGGNILFMSYLYGMTKASGPIIIETNTSCETQKLDFHLYRWEKRDENGQIKLLGEEFCRLHISRLIVDSLENVYVGLNDPAKTDFILLKDKASIDKSIHLKKYKDNWYTVK